jgi:hypothetical protein
MSAGWLLSSNHLRMRDFARAACFVTAEKLTTPQTEEHWCGPSPRRLQARIGQPHLLPGPAWPRGFDPY